MTRKHVIFVAVVVLVVVADLWTKHVAFEALEPRGRRGRGDIVVIEGFFHLHAVRNSGMAWSLFQNVDRRVWIGIRGALSVLLIGFYFTRPKLGAITNVAFACVVGGALGNLYDNIFAPGGEVRDFVLLYFWGWGFPVFNVADAMITLGAPVLLFHFAEPSKAPKAPEAPKEHPV